MSDDEEPTDQTSTGGYEVGYRKPPKHTRFKPGQSGDPRGRPKGTNNLKTDLMEELGEKIVIREGDQSHRVSKQRAVVKSIVARSLRRLLLFGAFCVPAVALPARVPRAPAVRAVGVRER